MGIGIFDFEKYLCDAREVARANELLHDMVHGHRRQVIFPSSNIAYENERASRFHVVLELSRPISNIVEYSLHALEVCGFVLSLAGFPHLRAGVQEIIES